MHFKKLFFISACVFLCAVSYAATPIVRKASTLPALTPLPMSIGGRMLTTPSAGADGFGGKDYTYQWPGSYFRAAFAGSRVFFRVGKSDEILRIVVDGQAAAPLVKPVEGAYEIDGLGKGRHAVSVLVATESQTGPNIFSGFAIAAGEKVLTLEPRHRQIEFIGDSHTVGFGNLSPTRTCSNDEIWARTDDTQAFGPLTAAHYDAEYQVNAISGRGVVRNYNGFQGDTLLEAYPYVLFDKKQKYDDPEWKPQVLVIALGTNDFSTPLNPGEPWKTRDELHADYEATYVKFLEGLRAKNPKAYIIVWATDVANGEVEAEAGKVVEQVKQGGDQHITFFSFHGLDFGACASHPSLSDEMVISGKLVRLIDADGAMDISN